MTNDNFYKPVTGIPEDYNTCAAYYALRFNDSTLDSVQKWECLMSLKAFSDHNAEKFRQRSGQFFFNMLPPKFSEEIRGKYGVDPFHQDEFMMPAVNHLYGIWITE